MGELANGRPKAVKVRTRKARRRLGGWMSGCGAGAVAAEVKKGSLLSEVRCGRSGLKGCHYVGEEEWGPRSPALGADQRYACTVYRYHVTVYILLHVQSSSRNVSLRVLVRGLHGKCIDLEAPLRSPEG